MATKKTIKPASTPGESEPKNIGKLINMWKRFFDDWAHEELNKHGYDYFKMGYMPFIMNISDSGSTNNEIAIKAKVTKQAMSKVVKELLAFDLIKIQKHETDARAALIFLTQKGKDLIADTKKCVAELSSEYIDIIGEKNYKVMVDSMYKIVKHHELKTHNKTLSLTHSI
jgi:DNA-binding MarR family transcriptional regulator